MKLADLHIHTKYSIEPSKFPLWQLKRQTIELVLQTAQKKGLSAVALSDHDNIEASFLAEKIAKKYNLIIIPAIEVTSRQGHILAYGVSKNIKPHLTAQATIEEIHRQNGLAVAAHPFTLGGGMNVFYKFKNRKIVSLLPLDGMEVVSCVTSVSQRAKKTAKILNLTMIGGSDAHCLTAVGYGLTVFPDSCQTKEDYLKVMKERKTFTMIGKGTRFGIWARTLVDSRLRYLLGL